MVTFSLYWWNWEESNTCKASIWINLRTSNSCGGEENFSRQRRRRDNFSPFSFLFFLSIEVNFWLIHTTLSNLQTITHFSSYYKTVTVDDDGGGRRWRREMRRSHAERWEKREIKRNKNCENTVKICGGGRRRPMKVNEEKVWTVNGRDKWIGSDTRYGRERENWVSIILN